MTKNSSNNKNHTPHHEIKFLLLKDGKELKNEKERLRGEFHWISQIII